VEDFIMEMVSVGEEGYQLQVELKSKINGEIPTAKVRIDLLLLP
jgi:hypothetical protein